MPLLRPLDPAFPIDRQLAVDATPVVLVNLVTLDKADEPRFLEAWQQLHRAIGDSSAYVNYAVWESTAHYRTAFTHPEFKASLATYPSSVVAIPHLFQKVAVPGICVA